MIYLHALPLIPQNLLIITILKFSLITCRNIKVPTWTKDYWSPDDWS